MVHQELIDDSKRILILHRMTRLIRNLLGAPICTSVRCAKSYHNLCMTPATSLNTEHMDVGDEAGHSQLASTRRTQRQHDNDKLGPSQAPSRRYLRRGGFTNVAGPSQQHT